MDLARLRDRCDRAFRSEPPSNVLARVRAIVGSESAMPSTEEGALAVEGYRRLKNGDTPTPKQLAALQYLLRLTRPAPLVHGGRPDDLPTDDHAQTFPGWAAFQTAVGCLRIVGRVDRASPTPASADTIGTGILVAPDRLLTNHHVVEVISRGTDVLEEGQAVVRFDWEDGSFSADQPVPITAVDRLHPKLDLALVRLKAAALPGGLPAAPFDASPVADNADVVVVGYPVDDSERNPLFIRQIFGAQFGVLRAAPGQCTSSFADGFYHDCSTLGGNSGSPVFSIDGRRLVGLHSGGGFLWKNTAIAGAALVAFIAP
jgi:S1-C subfamily serine protease